LWTKKESVFVKNAENIMTEHRDTALIVENSLHRFRLVIPILILFGLLTFDWIRSPKDQLSSHLTVILFDEYKVSLSNKLPFIKCRFEETCSDYARRAFIERGFVGGLVTTFGRITECF
jgi:hypothetical protein